MVFAYGVYNWGCPRLASPPAAQLVHEEGRHEPGLTWSGAIVNVQARAMFWNVCSGTCVLQQPLLYIRYQAHVGYVRSVAATVVCWASGSCRICKVCSSHYCVLGIRFM